MAKKTKFKSDAFEAVHTSATALLKVGAIDNASMRDLDISCLVPNVDSDTPSPTPSLRTLARQSIFLACRVKKESKRG